MLIRRWDFRIKVPATLSRFIAPPHSHVMPFAPQGSLVNEERLRFDFTCKAAMKPEQVGRAEQIVRDMIARKAPVQAQVASLGQAREIQGLRAMFGETYPDPVRVVSVGADIPTMLADPTNPVSLEASVEFCGGT